MSFLFPFSINMLKTLNLFFNRTEEGKLGAGRGKLSKVFRNFRSGILIWFYRGARMFAFFGIDSLKKNYYRMYFSRKKIFF